MALTLSSPVTGTAQTGLTNPTYTHVVDSSPNGQNGKQYAVSALGGTQTGVEVHSISNPFTINFVRPAVWKQLGPANPITGLPGSVPRNQIGCVARKGVQYTTGSPFLPCVARFTLDIPAGADVADPESVRACISMMIGSLSQLSSSIGDLAVTGTI